MMLRNLSAATAYDLGWVTLANPPTAEGVMKTRAELLRLEQGRDRETAADTPRSAITLEHHSMNTFMGNPFLTVFTALRDLRARLLAEDSEAPEQVTAGAPSAEKDEDKPERGSEELLHRLMDVILLYFSQYTGGRDWLRRYV